MSLIAPAELQARILAGAPALVLDVRTPGEHAGLHVPGAHLLPLDRLDPAAVARLRPGDAPVYLLCRSGARATRAAEQLGAAGIAGCVVVSGGTEDWAAAGLPVVRGRGVMSIERQVRIAAGALVVVGVSLGVLVQPWFLALAGGVGAGLVITGIADWCGMGLLIARMPWNRTGAAR
jgi:rhodanese-related sulfurtransferase